MFRFDDPVGFLKGATPSVRRAWEGIGIETVGDLLLTVPKRYDDYSKITSIAGAEVDAVSTVRGRVVSASLIPSFRKRLKFMRVTIKDGSGRLTATFFHQPWLLETFIAGSEFMFSGKVSDHPRFGRSMTSPVWEPANAKSVAAGKIAPVYPLSGSLTQKRVRTLVPAALEETELPPESLTDETRSRLHLLGIKEALNAIHTPKTIEEAEHGRERLAFDELLAYRLALGQTQKISEEAGAPVVPFDEVFAKCFVAGLSFWLTGDQRRAAWTAIQSMGDVKPMRRLLQGDVGSGKTVVAAFLAAQTVRAGQSAAILVPTDILAKQHATGFARMFVPHNLSFLLFTRTDQTLWEGGEVRTLTRREAEERIKQGHLALLGTHALLEMGRLPDDLALSIIDEQHRFGVAQRETLITTARKDGLVPHLLSMTATPIPRSLVLTLYGDLEVSVLKEKPPGRQPIQTEVCIGAGRTKAYDAIRTAMTRGEQAFIVCPLIDPSDTLGAKSATEEWKRLTKGPLTGLRIGLLHGRLKPWDKDAVMREFVEGHLDVLVATAVIEVGVDVPNATVMAIEGAERFGLAQLHQFRGRVGRSHLASRCFLLADVEGEPKERLEMVARTNDGFRLAEEDLKRRGGGNLFGTEQSGHNVFKAARPTDLILMTAAREEAERMLTEDKTLAAMPFWQERVKRLKTTNHLE